MILEGEDMGMLLLLGVDEYCSKFGDDTVVMFIFVYFDWTVSDF